MRRYVLVVEYERGACFCLGIYDNYKTALGFLMDSLFETWESYDENKGDFFRIGKPYLMDGEGGECIEVTRKFVGSEVEHKEYYMILYDD